MFLQNRYALFTSGILLGFSLCEVWDLPYKYFLKAFYLSDYGEHVYLCDNAMRQHLIAKTRVVSSGSSHTVDSLKNAEVGLLDCHAYDKFRKKLITLGLDENDLSEMGLKAIESSRTQLRKIVQQHEISY